MVMASWMRAWLCKNGKQEIVNNWVRKYGSINKIKHTNKMSWVSQNHRFCTIPKRALSLSLCCSFYRISMHILCEMRNPFIFASGKMENACSHGCTMRTIASFVTSTTRLHVQSLFVCETKPRSCSNWRFMIFLSACNSLHKRKEMKKTP